MLVINKLNGNINHKKRKLSHQWEIGNSEDRKYQPEEARFQSTRKRERAAERWRASSARGSLTSNYHSYPFFPPIHNPKWHLRSFLNSWSANFEDSEEQRGVVYLIENEATWFIDDVEAVNRCHGLFVTLIWGLWVQFEKMGVSEENETASIRQFYIFITNKKIFHSNHSSTQKLQSANKVSPRLIFREHAKIEERKQYNAERETNKDRANYRDLRQSRCLSLVLAATATVTVGDLMSRWMLWFKPERMDKNVLSVLFGRFGIVFTQKSSIGSIFRLNPIFLKNRCFSQNIFHKISKTNN